MPLDLFINAPGVAFEFTLGFPACIPEGEIVVEQVFLICIMTLD